MPPDRYTLDMEIPDLVHEELGGEEIRSGVAIGDEEVVCATATRTLIYRPDGLLSDERVETFPHEVDQLVLSEGRRKTTFKLTYVDGTRSFSVPARHSREVLTLLLEGILGVDGVLDEDESVVGAFRFSELTLVIAENRLVRHIGETVWDEDFTQYEYADLTGLDFQEGSVATEIAISIDGRPQRIKTPREDARLVEETIKKAVFEFYDVATMAELQQVVEPTEEDAPATDEPDDLTLGSNIDPLVSGTEGDQPSPAEGDQPNIAEDDQSRIAENEPEPAANSTTEPEPGPANTRTPAADREPKRSQPGSDAGDHESRESTADTPVNEHREAVETTDEFASTGSAPTETPTADQPTAEQSTADQPTRGSLASNADVATADEVEALREQVSELSAAVERQNKLLKKQHRAIKHLLENRSAE
ncbi:conserved hypothetical protein [Halorhabdus utahensis DSM 12940]|uniref:DUF7115 domain-containing protein n=2 Tax=Halorhabdus utahensis TaxID=146826 RepID=C7NN70_HALUD|nr:conserved hypothetical protein [Halorhabdus utahensis DSM 12940]